MYRPAAHVSLLHSTRTASSKRTGSRGWRHSPGTQHPRASSASRSPVAPWRRGAMPRSTRQRNRTCRAEVVERVTRDTCLPKRARSTNNRGWTKAKFQERSASPRRRRAARLHTSTEGLRGWPCGARRESISAARGGPMRPSYPTAPHARQPAVGRKCAANFHFRAIAGAGNTAGRYMMPTSRPLLN